MWVGTSKSGGEAARRANEAEARVATEELARANFLWRVHFTLYLVTTGELASLIILLGGGWFALLAPVLAAFGPRYCSMGSKIMARSFFAVLLALAILGTLVKKF